MDSLAGQPSIASLGFVFASDGYWNFNDGLAFDNVKIQDPYANDVGVVAAISPTSAVTLSPTEIVRGN